jgi:hypothetical protein
LISTYIYPKEKQSIEPYYIDKIAVCTFSKVLNSNLWSIDMMDNGEVHYSEPPTNTSKEIYIYNICNFD